MALNTGYALRTGSFEAAKKTKNNNNKETEEKSPQDEALARYNAVKVNHVVFFINLCTLFKLDRRLIGDMVGF